MMSVELLHYTRGDFVENIHRGDGVCVDVNGNIIDKVGNEHLPMFWRSAAKPFQLLQFVKLGGVEKFNLTQKELAILASSHSGEKMHEEVVLSILEKIGVSVEALNCGVARPMSGKAFKDLVKNNLRPTVLNNPCSGKHTAIIALCQLLEIPFEDYIKPEHESQKIIHKIVAMSAGINEDELKIGIDGCGVPVFYLPLDKMAYAYARLANAEEGNWGEYTEAAIKIRDTMLAYPEMVSGTGRIDKAVTQLTNGRILAKIGADAVYCLASREKKAGIAFKIEDGSYAAVTPMVIAMLKHFDFIDEKEEDELLKMYPPVLKNHRGDIIGEIKTVF